MSKAFTNCNADELSDSRNTWTGSGSSISPMLNSNLCTNFPNATDSWHTDCSAYNSDSQDESDSACCCRANDRTSERSKKTQPPEIPRRLLNRYRSEAGVRKTMEIDGSQLFLTHLTIQRRITSREDKGNMHITFKKESGLRWGVGF